MLLVQVCVAELGKDRLAISFPMTTERWDQVRLWRTVKPDDAVEDHQSSGRLKQPEVVTTIPLRF